MWGWVFSAMGVEGDRSFGTAGDCTVFAQTLTLLILTKSFWKCDEIIEKCDLCNVERKFDLLTSLPNTSERIFHNSEAISVTWPSVRCNFSAIFAYFWSCQVPHNIAFCTLSRYFPVLAKTRLSANFNISSTSIYLVCAGVLVIVFDNFRSDQTKSDFYLNSDL